MKGCTRARRWLLLAADGELGLDERLRLDAHLERCAACRAERDALDALEAAVLGLPEPPPVEARDLDRAVAAVRARIAGASAQEDAAAVRGADGERVAAGRHPRPGADVARRRIALAAAGLAAAALLAWLGARALAGRDGAPSGDQSLDGALAERGGGATGRAPAGGDGAWIDRTVAGGGPSADPAFDDRGAPPSANGRGSHDAASAGAAHERATADSGAGPGAGSPELASAARPSRGRGRAEPGPDLGSGGETSAGRGEHGPEPARVVEPPRAEGAARIAAVDPAVAPDAAGSADGESGAGDEAPEGEASSADAAVDPARLAAARDAVARELARAFAGLPPAAPPAEVAAAVRTFERATAELDRGWPVLRLVEGHVAHADTEVAVAAVRVLGGGGDALSATALRDALERPALAREAVDALGALGTDGLGGLAVALRRPELAELARARVAAIGGPRAAAVLADAARRRGADAPDGTERELLLGALAAVEPCPAGAVLDLARDGVVAPEAAHRALADASGGPAALAALAREARRGGEPDEAELLTALAVARPAVALPWIAEQARDRRAGDAALDCLAAYADEPALAELVELHATGRARSSLVVGAAARLLATAPDAGVDLARRAADAEPLDGARAAAALRDLLLDVGSADAAPGLVALAFGGALAAQDRPWALLAAGELGRRSDSAALARGAGALGAGEELLAAAALLAASALGERDAVLLALDQRVPLDARRADALVALCADARDRGARATTLFQVARELRPLFDATTLSTGRP